MSRLRILGILIGSIVVLGLVLWLADTLIRLYTSLAVVSPLLARGALTLLILLIAALIAALVYYAALFLRPRRPARARIQPPVEKSDAAEKTLDAVRQQLNHIEDEIVRQALIEKSRDIAEQFTRGAIRIVVFGTGSAGKTSLINALMGRVVGDVGAPMGTTQMGETYSLRLRGLERTLELIDTPGILEVGATGSERDRLARQLALDANLLIVVVDTDLRQSEYAPIRQLAQMGKRSLLALNKTDRLTEEDQAVLLEKLRQRVHPLIPAADVVAIAANPQPLQTEAGEWIQPDPDIVPLLRRMAEVLRTEGEDLIADTILFQTQQLGEEARRLVDTQRRHQAEKIVDRFQWVGAGVVSFTPLPFVDLLATAAVNAQMVVELGKVYGCDINVEHGKELALSLAKTLISLGLVRGAVELFSIALQTNVSTFLIGRAIQGATAAYLTRIAGKSFIEYFRRDQDWGDGGMAEVVQEQFQLNRRDEFMKAFVQEAVSRVVQPLIRTEPNPNDNAH